MSSLVFVTILIIAMGMGDDWVSVMRDPVDPSRHPLAGLLSDIGIMVLAAGTLFYLLRLSGQKHWTVLSCLTAALPAVIVLDDLLMLHERFFEIGFYAVYAVAGACLIGLQIVRAPAGSVLLVAAMVFMGLSIVVDMGSSDPRQQVFGVSYWKLRAVLEDLFKFIGYALFSGHLVQSGYAMQKPRFAWSRTGRVIE